MVTKWFRWLFKRCMDCGVKLPRSWERGDVCQKCFDDFDGLTIEEIIGEPGMLSYDKLIEMGHLRDRTLK